MDANTLTTLITSVGFPIVACIGMFWYLTRIMDKRDEKINTTLLQMTEVVSENNKLIDMFSQKMDMLFRLIELREKGVDDNDVRRS